MVKLVLRGYALYSRIEEAYWTGERRLMRRDAWSEEESKAKLFPFDLTGEGYRRANDQRLRFNDRGWETMIVCVTGLDYQS